MSALESPVAPRLVGSTGLAAVALSVCLSALSCGGKEPQALWRLEARSPDSTYVATAAGLQWAGPGNAYVATEVYLKRGLQDSVTVLTFDQALVPVRMRWPSPRQLVVTYDSTAVRDSGAVTFQAVKYMDVAIALQRGRVGR
jgi:hypothetical protein